MSENTQNTQVAPVSTEVPEVSVKSVLGELYGDFRIDPETHRSSGTFGTRSMSGFDRLARSDRNKVVSAIESRFDRYMADGAFEAASGIRAVWRELTAKPVSGGSSKNVTESDVRARMGEMVAMLRFAADALFAGSVPVAGWDGLVPILDESDIPDLSDEQCEIALNRYATARIGTKARENDIPDMLRNVLGTCEIGTFHRISAIRNKMAEMYPNKGISSTWDGRLNAALFGANWDGTDYQPISSTAPIRHEWDEKGRAGVFVASHPISDESDTASE